MNKFQKRVMYAAIAYAEMGWAVLPTSKGSKKPVISGGSRSATTDVRKIEAWWKNNPSANIGIATGKINGFWVVDIDMKDARDGLQALQNEFGAEMSYAKEWMTQKTATGGIHLLFECPEDFEVHNKQGVLDGVDLRGEGGYVVAAPSSINVDGAWIEYRWRDFGNGVIGEAPEWAINLAMREDGIRRGGKINVLECLEGLTDGKRDTGLFKFACLLRQRGIPQPLAEAFICTAAEKCNPPFEESVALVKVDQAYNNYKDDDAKDYFIAEMKKLRSQGQ